MLVLRSLLLLLILSSFSCLTAQKVSKRDQPMLAEVRDYIDLAQYNRARVPLERLLKKYDDIADLYYLRSIILQERNDFPAAIADIERGLALDGGSNPTVYSVLAKAHAANGDYAASLAAYERYLSGLQKKGASQKLITKAEALVASSRIAAELAADPVPFTPRPLRGLVNTDENLEYFPSLSIDGNSLIFTRRDGRGEDFYQSDLKPDSTWGAPYPLQGVNTPMNEGAQTITADGNYLVFTACNREEGLGACDLFFSQKIDGEWTEARSVGANVNTNANDRQPSLSADGKLLFFSSNRSGGYGKYDLYVSGREADGTWSKPINLGATVNTPEEDLFPFWAADNQTLYFTSTGHPGMGGADLFKTTVNAENKWEIPLNLGFPINTAGEETNIFIALDGKTAYFSKGEDLEGGGQDIDIYSFELPQSIRPLPATYVEVNVTDASTGEPLRVEIRLIPLDGSSPPSVQTTNEDGHFVSVLPSGRNYGLSIERTGYLFYSDQFVLADGYTPEEPYRLMVELQPIVSGAINAEAEEDGAIALRNVFFETGSAELLAVSTEELDRLVKLLTDQEDLRIEIAGHTDDVGSEEANQSLSEARAESVTDYLVSQGITRERVQSVGYGESKPVASNATPQGRAENRRTTFRLLF